MTNTPIEALSAINVGVVNDQGLLEAVITLEEFVRVAKSQHIYMHTNAPRGEIDFDLGAIVSCCTTSLVSTPWRVFFSIA